MSVEPLSPDTCAQLDRIGSADVVVGAAGCRTVADVQLVAAAVAGALGRLLPTGRAVLVHPDGIDPDELGRAVDLDAGTLHLVGCRLSAERHLPFTTLDHRDTFQALFTASERLGARSCVLMGSQTPAITAATVQVLAQPAVEAQADLVLPCYPRHEFDGLIDKGIVYPLTRALYGRRVSCQLGVDFGFSDRFIHTVLRTEPVTRRAPRWLLTEAIMAGLEPCQAHLATWLPPADGAPDVSTALASVLGPLFVEIERTATFWQRVRGSQTVRVTGDATWHDETDRSIDAASMVDSFQFGCRNLQEVWSLVLTPATLLELRAAARLPPERFHLHDTTWAHILYDFALGHRLGVISRDHLLGSMTPLYLAWVASLVVAARDAGPGIVHTRVEELCAVCEAEKPYLIARWRWPDRFNP